MGNEKEIKLDRKAVSRAIRKPLEAYYKAAGSGGYNGLSERPGDWEENEELCKAITKSKYVSHHLDWPYILEIVFAVLEHYPQLSPDDFAEKLELAIAETVGQRDYLAVVPLGFRKIFGLPHLQELPLRKPMTIGDFTLSPATPSVKAFNKLTVKHDFPPIKEFDFGHATRTSNNAFSREILLTFNAHGAEDRLRFNIELKVRPLCRLIEVFANLFGKTDRSLGQTKAVNHFFLLGKTSEELRRFPTSKPLSFDFELSDDLLSSLKRPEFNDFFKDILSSPETIYGRLRNAVKFFSMAFNADDSVTSFLFYVISIESIFSRDKNAPIKGTLADLASLLCFPPEQRRAAHEIIRKSYDLRSSIVHSGTTSVQQAHVDNAKLIAARAIYCSLFLCKHLKTGSGKLEDKFFDHLRDLKLGIVKPIIPRAIWALPEIGVADE